MTTGKETGGEMKQQRGKKKAVSVVIAAGMLLLSLTGCGSREEAGMQAPSAESPQSDQEEEREETKEAVQEDGTETVEGTQGTEENSSAARENRRVVEAWAGAWIGRDGETIAAMSSEAVQEALQERELLFQEGDTYTFGWSSPWPDEDYQLEEVTDNSAVILYYARTSDPHVTVWRESLTWHSEADGSVVEAEELERLGYICSGEEYVRAYPHGIENTPMDYLGNGMGEALNQNAMQNKDNVSYSGLFAPETAVVQELNLLNNPEKVKVETVPDVQSDRVLIHITFTEDGSTVAVSAVCPYGEDGIWIVQDSGAKLE